MAARKNKKPIKEDAFGTPPAARGGMMNVAGASDDDVEPDEELLSDCDGRPDEYEGGNDTVGAPFYPREGVVRVKVGDLRRLVAGVIRRPSNR